MPSASEAFKDGFSNNTQSTQSQSWHDVRGDHHDSLNFSPPPTSQHFASSGDDYQHNTFKNLRSKQHRMRSLTQRMDTVADRAISSASATSKRSTGLRSNSSKGVSTIQPLSDSGKSDSDNCITCMICAEDSIEFLAVGKCNHAICSLCACRLRVKSKQQSCCVCKGDVLTMVVYQYQGKFQPFDSFGVDDESLVDFAAGPGMQADPSSGLLFIDCPQHYKDIQLLKSIACPIASCGERFGQTAQLLSHLHKRVRGRVGLTLFLQPPALKT